MPNAGFESANSVFKCRSHWKWQHVSNNTVLQCYGTLVYDYILYFLIHNIRISRLGRQEILDVEVKVKLSL
jgi:hypothetical protein